MHTFPIRQTAAPWSSGCSMHAACPNVWVAEVRHSVDARMVTAFTGDSDYTVETLQAHRMDHGKRILPNEVHNVARYASWMSLVEAADHCFEQRLQEHEVELGRR